MPDTSKYRSIAVPLDTYNKLSKICQEEHRVMGKQMTKFVDDHFKRIFKDEQETKNELTSKGVGSL